MVTQKQFKDHYNNLYNSGAIYVWGANGEIITQELMDKLFKAYGSTTYNRTYYDNKLKEGKGKIGADCSGSIYPLSKADNTAKGYYQLCTAANRGGIVTLPKATACLVFNAAFTHVGAYMGDGITIEMASSTKNCVKQAFQQSRWAYWGIPSWLSTEGVTETVAPAIAPSTGTDLMKAVQTWANKNFSTGLVVDGKFGPNTKKGLCKALQTTLNNKFGAKLTVDGAFGPNTKAACVAASKDTALTYICQAMLYAAGYDVSHSLTTAKNDFDGKYGLGMQTTVRKYQAANRGLMQDGICGPATFYVMFN